MADDARRKGGGKAPDGGGPVEDKPAPVRESETSQRNPTLLATKKGSHPSPPLPPAEMPFASADDEWESELAAWDAAIPIVSNPVVIVSPEWGTPGPHAATHAGAVPEEENPFFDTPTTIVSPADRLDLDDLPDVVSAGAFDDGVAPASGSYAALVATDESAPGLFDRDPSVEEPPSFPSETLREMTAVPWSQDIKALVALGEAGPTMAPPRAYWDTLGRILNEERAAATAAADKKRAAVLSLAAARVAELLGHPKEALAYIETVLETDAANAAAHRAVLGLAERSGGIEDDAAGASLARLALTPHADQPYYRALHAEWILARAARGIVDRTAAAAIMSLPDGLGRLLAETELAWTEPAVAAAILEGAGHRVGGGLGAALMSWAAGLNEVARDFQAAAEQRFVASRLNEQGPLLSLAVLRDLARLEPESQAAGLEELIPRVPPSPLRVAMARWGASAALRAGDAVRAHWFVFDAAEPAPGVIPSGLARDRMDLWNASRIDSPSRRSAAADVSLSVMFAPVARSWSGSSARVVVALRACEVAIAAGVDIDYALTAAEDLAGRATTDDGTSALAAAVEELANQATEKGSQLRGLRLWRRLDPARWTSASLDLADALVPTADDGIVDTGGESTESILEEMARRDATSPVFWALSALATRRGRVTEAAAHIDQALERAAWRASALAAPLAELAAELTARSNIAAGVQRLTAGFAKAIVTDASWATLGRSLRQLRDRDLWAEYVQHEAAVVPTEKDASERERARRVNLLLEPVFWPSEAGEGDDVPSLVSAALDVSPLHPIAFGLALAGHPEPATLIDRLLAAGSNRGGRDWVLGASLAAALAGDAPRALALSTQIGGIQTEPIEARLAGAVKATIRRLAWAAPDSEQRTRLMREFGDAQVPVDLSVPEGHEGARDRLRPLLDAAHVPEWDDVVQHLVDNPPHEKSPGSDTLALAAMIDEGRCDARRSRELWSRARDALPLPDVAAAKGVNATEPMALLHAGDRPDGDPSSAGAALEQLAEAAARVPDERSAALFLLAAGGPVDASAVAERRLRAAVAHDPHSAAVAIAWRRWLTIAGRVEEAARASALEAEALSDSGLRIQALLRAAAMLVTPVGVQAMGGQSASDAGTDRVTEAARFLQRALEISPHDHEVFTRLRDLYEEAGRHADLASLLAVRMNATSNPFEVTALHLTRADLFAGPLGDHVSAKRELEAILQKEPQHARALARLADLEGEDGNDAAAADLLIRRAFTERSPEKLRELFLRLGRIYTRRLPDAKRAVGAYARVLQLDANNREALDELSLLYLGLGESKSAASITERLVQLETVPERRSRYHMRLGQLFERAADPRSAGLHFRRAAEDAPRDVEALGELIRHLEKTRDTPGRRAYLERAATELRGAVLINPTDRTAIDALVAVLRWRGRAASAAAAAELAAFVGRPGAATSSLGASSLPDWAVPPAAGRSLAALAKPSVDEQTFPPSVLPSVRHLFRLLGALLGDGRSDLLRHGVDRADRVSGARPPRDVFDAVAADLAAGPFDLYVGHTQDALGRAATLAVEPGKTPSIIMSAAILKMGPAAVRFAAARALRLVATHLDTALVGPEADLGAWLGSVIRQFVPDYVHPGVPLDQMVERTARVAKLMPRRLRNEILPFAMESSGALDLGLLRAGIREAADRVGLLASGSLAAGLRVVLATAGGADANAGGATAAAALAGNAEATALLAFALSDDYDDLVKALE